MLLFYNKYALKLILLWRGDIEASCVFVFYVYYIVCVVNTTRNCASS